ncbi:hypothetical protein BKE30_13770 [Alkanindiges hydrocarboniclasticus]|uniref:ParB-like N-terminal domain-containing protein n=1 Tax=Alkanindiges hydrocarboniclasticus TaxID=1907941 RepID=A0A1S8CQT0_9GAMM|nr:ParB/RepB/Spo0J family partition protein [Alkanindiges hydrocarboniclasticus]ONG37740.1 hypothetical protein BKE30_13770 [Alkanindiges hydrocarboniclasticus]
MAKNIKEMLEKKLAENSIRHAEAQQEADFDAGRQYIKLNLELIDPNPYQPRSTFAPDEIQTLAASIKESGLLQPVSVRQVNDRYQLIAGERRYRAHQLLNKSAIDAIIIPVSDEEMGVLALTENIDREDLYDYEIGKALRKIETLFPNKKKLAESIGLNRQDMYRYFAYEELPSEIIERLDLNPALLSRTAAVSLKRVLKEYESPKLSSLLREGWDLLEQGLLEQTKLADWIIDQLHKKPSSPQQKKPDPSLIKEISLAGKKVGYLSKNSRQLVVKLNAVLFDDEQTDKLQSYIQKIIEGEV